MKTKSSDVTKFVYDIMSSDTDKFQVVLMGKTENDTL